MNSTEDETIKKSETVMITPVHPPVRRKTEPTGHCTKIWKRYINKSKVNNNFKLSVHIKPTFGLQYTTYIY